MSVIYGSVEPFEQILRAAQELMDGYEYAAAETYAERYANAVARCGMSTSNISVVSGTFE